MGCLTAEYSPFLGIEKGAVLQEARVFNDPQLDARRCSQVFIYLLILSYIIYFVFVALFSSRFLTLCMFVICFFQVITKLLYLLNQGETFTKVKSFASAPPPPNLFLKLSVFFPKDPCLVIDWPCRILLGSLLILFL